MTESVDCLRIDVLAMATCILVSYPQLKFIWQLLLHVFLCFNGQSASQHSVSRLLPVSRSLVTLWNMAVVPEGLKGLPFRGC